MSSFLLELLSEEIPARMQAGARAELEKCFRAAMLAVGVEVNEVTLWSTPRRLVLMVAGLPQVTPAVSEELKGPRVTAPAQALEGFLRKTGLTHDQLMQRDDTWFVRIEKPGRAMLEVLAEAVPAILRGFSWPKSMRWGDASLSSASQRWVRPLQGIVTLLDDAVVDCALGSLRSGRKTMGHRFHAPGEVEITSTESYAAQLRNAHVVVDHTEREAIIRQGARVAAAGAGLTLVEDEGLVIENAGLTEWPVPLLGRFDTAFLDVPPEVIQLTARVNQKYFICRDDAGAGRLANGFVCTANIVARDAGEAIVAGNRKVLAARLADARFFWDQDRRKRLAEHATGLARIIFHEKLGTLADKVARVAKLSRWLAEHIVPGADLVLAEQAAKLCKADLVTFMVGEFPELQGLMGGYYARAEGLGDDIADAIRDHYKPVGQGDMVPSAPVSMCVALADKLDTLVQFFAHGLKPTGSKDPFALRRAALGAIQIILGNGLRLELSALSGCEVVASVPDDFITFFADRLKVQQKEAGVRHDLIDAVFALGGEDDLVRLLARVSALQGFVVSDDGAKLLAGYKRAANILKAEQKRGWVLGAVNFSPEPDEAALAAALADVELQAEAAVSAEDFVGAMEALARLCGPIDRFFDTVTVNMDDEIIRAARLSLLDRFRVAVHKVADFSHIES